MHLAQEQVVTCDAKHRFTQEKATNSVEFAGSISFHHFPPGPNDRCFVLLKDSP